MNYIDFVTESNPSLISDGSIPKNVEIINPFLENLMTVIALLIERVNAKNFNFRLISSFLLHESKLKIKTLVANFGSPTNYKLTSNYVVKNGASIIT